MCSCSHHVWHRHGCRWHGGRTPASRAAHGFGLPVSAASHFLLPRLCPLHVWSTTHTHIHIILHCRDSSLHTHKKKKIWITATHFLTDDPLNCRSVTWQKEESEKEWGRHRERRSINENSISLLHSHSVGSSPDIIKTCILFICMSTAPTHSHRLNPDYTANTADL